MRCGRSLAGVLGFQPGWGGAVVAVAFVVSLAAGSSAGVAAGARAAVPSVAGSWSVSDTRVGLTAPDTYTFTATPPGSDTYYVTNDFGFHARVVVGADGSATARWTSCAVDPCDSDYFDDTLDFTFPKEGRATFTGTISEFSNDGGLQYTWTQTGFQLSAPAAAGGSLDVSVSLASKSALVGREVAVSVRVTAGGSEDLSGVSLGNGLVPSSAAVVVSQSAPVLRGFDLSKGASRSFEFELKAKEAGTVALRVDASGAGDSGEVHGSAQATLKVVDGVLSVADVTRGTGALSADVRVKLEDSSTDASGCDPKASYDFTDPQLSSARDVGPCSYELTFEAPGTGIYHVGLRATDSSGVAIPVSVDQYGATVDGRFNLIIDSCSKPEDDVPDVEALLNAGDGLCALAVGEWDSDAADVAAKVLAAVERSPTLAVDPIPVDSIDPSDWPGSRSPVIQSKAGAETGWVPTGTKQPPEIGKPTELADALTSGDAAALVQVVHLPPLPSEWSGVESCPYGDDHPSGVVISAHGLWYTPNGLMRVPAGDRISTYVPIGTSMVDPCLGQDIDRGHVHGDDTRYLHVYTAGQLMPNFTFLHLDFEFNRHVVNPTSPITLNNLIRPNEGKISIAACASLFIPAGASLTQALSSVPIHTPGTSGAAGYSRVTITQSGELQASAASGTP